MLKHDIENEFHSALVHFIDECLESDVCACRISIFRYIPVVDFREVHGMVAVVIEAGSILHNRSDPDGGKAECLDVVEFVDESLEVAAPFGVIDVVDAIPAVDVVVGVTIIESRGHREIDGFIAEVGAVTHESGSRRSHGHRGQD